MENAKELVICGHSPNRVIVIDRDADWADKRSIKWEWSPDTSDGLSAEQKKCLGSLDECKPVLGLSHILISSSSSGAIALLSKADKKVRFYAEGANAHSAEILPDGNIVSAHSIRGNMLKVHCTLPGSKETASYPLCCGHGAVWDRKRALLWALSRRHVIGYEYNFKREEPRLKQVISCLIPGVCGPDAYPEHVAGKCGHDLFPVLGRDRLFVTEETGVYEFDPEKCSMEALPFKGKIKSISENGPGGTIALQKVDGGKKVFWNDKIYFLRPEGSKSMPGAMFYKARWNCINTFSYPEGPLASSSNR